MIGKEVLIFPYISSIPHRHNRFIASTSERVVDMRIPLIAGNHKMNMTWEASQEYVSVLKHQLKDLRANVEVVIFPPFTSLQLVSTQLEGTAIGLGAQDVFWEQEGAFTGEISAEMLKACQCQYVLCGHSERRHILKETDEMINAKLRRTLKVGLRPILCVGEQLQERELGQTASVIQQQLLHGLRHCHAKDLEYLVVAYEPVWAIGTGKTATVEDANKVCTFIRARLGEWYGQEMAEKVRIQYGGSVNAQNIAELMTADNIDGALVGGASLHAQEFAAIAKYDA